MKKNKEWLKEELTKQIDILHTTISSDNYVKLVKRAEIMGLIDQLDEPDLTFEYRKGYEQGVLNAIQTANESKLVEIPQFIADYLDDFKKQNLTLGDALDTHFEDDKQIHTWLYEDGELRNDEVFARAWIDDNYTIEKEPDVKVSIKSNDKTEFEVELPESAAKKLINEFRVWDK